MSDGQPWTVALKLKLNLLPSSSPPVFGFCVFVFVFKGKIQSLLTCPGDGDLLGKVRLLCKWTRRRGVTEAGSGVEEHRHPTSRLAFTKRWVSRLALRRLPVQRATATFLAGWKMLALSLSPAWKVVWKQLLPLPSDPCLSEGSLTYHLSFATHLPTGLSRAAQRILEMPAYFI